MRKPATGKFVSRTVVAGVLVVALSLPAGAEERSFSLERLRLAVDRLGVIDAESGAVLSHLAWDSGLWLTFEDDPLVVKDVATGDRLGRLVDARVGGSLVGALGLYDRFEIGLELPLVLYQDRSSNIPGVTTAPLPSLTSIGVGDLRLAPKVSLLRTADQGVDLAIAIGVTFPTGGATDYKGEEGMSLVPEVDVSRALGPLLLVGNVGYRLRKDQTLLNQEVADEIFLRLAAAYRPASAPWDAGLSLSTAVAAAAPFAHANQDALELNAAGGYRIGERWAVIGGAGVGLANGYGTPDFRFFAGVRFGETSDDPDHDGFHGHADECPRQAEDRDGFQDQDGCADPDNDNDKVPDVADGAPLDPEDPDGFQDSDGVPDPDNDGDGILDTADKCPGEPETKNGYLDDDGCPDVIPDSDGDGLKDDVDKCPSEPEDMDGFQDQDGCDDPDNDGDSILDDFDRCPMEKGPTENNGCPDTDRDGDTVVDRLDNCPDEKGTVANKGCREKQLVQITSGGIEILDKVYFKLNAATIERKSYKLLDNVARVILSHPDIGVIRVEGHTDDQGDDASNMDLSQRRAEAVVAYLVKKGVPRERLEAKGYGETVPIADNTTKVGRATNRRVEFKIVGGPGAPGTQPATAPVIKDSGNRPEDTLEP
jgi:outer membrane protein OmpA-like peptidoglycan-associated protein